MLDDNFLWDHNAIYFLQPSSDQVISIRRLLRENDPKLKLVAIMLPGERRHNGLGGYDQIVNISRYEEIPPFVNVVPGGASATEALLKFRDITIGKITMRRNALAVYDKPLFMQHCQHHNLPVPSTYGTLAEVPPENYPIFYKQKHEQGGGVRGVAHSPQDIPSEELESLIFQEYVVSKGTYGVGFIADNGVLKVALAHYEKESQPKVGGSAIIVEHINSARLIELTAKVISSLNYSGWGLAEYKFCNKRKDFLFMEINAKFWASCEFAFRNEPKFLEKMFNVEGKKEEIDSMYFVNRALARNIFFTIFKANKFFKSKKIIYPGIFKSAAHGILPKNTITVLKKIKIFSSVKNRYIHKQNP